MRWSTPLAFLTLMGTAALNGAPAQIVTDGTVGPAVSLTGAAVVVGSDLGTIAGTNLFHSFFDFNVNSGQSVTFTGPESLQDVLARVTGGRVSDISGTLRSSVGQADLWLINPAGVVFGPGASIDVPASFHVSTADEVRFADGTSFSAMDPAASTLTTASPEAFGFLSTTPADLRLTMDGGSTAPQLTVASNATLTLAAGQIDNDGGNLAAPGGRINLVTLGGAGQVDARTGATDAGLGGSLRSDNGTRTNPAEISVGFGDDGLVFVHSGAVDLVDTRIVSEHSGSLDSTGGVTITAGSLRLDNAALTSTNRGAGAGGPISVTAAAIELLSNGKISSTANADGRGGDIFATVTGGDLTLSGQSAQFSTFAFRTSPGDITISVTDGNLELTGADASISSLVGSEGGGRSGSLVIGVRGGDLVVTGDGAEIETSTLGVGGAGTLTATVTDGDLSMSGFFSNIGTFDQFNASQDAGGGKVTVKVVDGSVNIFGDSSGIRTHSTAEQGGPIDVIVERGNLNIATAFDGVTSLATGTGRGGNVSVTVSGDLDAGTGNLVLSNFGRINASSITDAPTGDLFISAPTGRVTVTGSASINNNPQGGATSTGRAGNIELTAREVVLTDFGEITTSAFSAADSGMIFVDAEELTLTDFGSITSDSFSAGRGGVINIVGGSLTLRDSGQITAESTSLEDATGGAGNIIVDVDTVTIDNAKLSSSTSGSGSAGTVSVTADVVTVTNQGSITSEVQFGAAGEAGDVSITVNDNLTVSGLGSKITSGTTGTEPGGTVTVSGASVTLTEDASIIASTVGGGDAGNIDLMVDRLLIDDDARIETATAGPGAAGTITVQVREQATLRGGGLIDSVAFTGTGDSGDIVFIATDELVIDGFSDNASGLYVNAQSLFADAGNAGVLTVQAGTLTLDNFGTLASRTFGPGNAGAVTVSADRIEMRGQSAISSGALGFATGRGGQVSVTGRSSVTVTGGAEIDSLSVGPLGGGEVTVQAPAIMISDGGAISAESFGTGDSGRILVVASDRLSLHDGAITTRAGQAGGGGIELQVGTLIDLLDSEITTEVQGLTGDAGDIVIDPIFLVLQNSVIRANAIGGDGGNIRIEAGSLISDRASVIDASSELGVSGTVTISSPDTDVSGGLVVLSADFIDAASQLADRCAAAAAGQGSRFAAIGRGGLPAGPETMLPGYLLDEDSLLVGPADRPGPPGPADGRTARLVPVQLAMVCGA